MSCEQIEWFVGGSQGRERQEKCHGSRSKSSKQLVRNNLGLEGGA